MQNKYREKIKTTKLAHQVFLTTLILVFDWSPSLSLEGSYQRPMGNPADTEGPQDPSKIGSSLENSSGARMDREVLRGT